MASTFVRSPSQKAYVSRLTDLIAQAKAKGPALGNELEREFKALAKALTAKSWEIARFATTNGPTFWEASVRFWIGSLCGKRQT